MNLLLPDPLAFTGPFPLADLAPQYMTRERIESVVLQAPKFFQTGGDLPDDGDVPAKAVARVSNRAVVKYGTQISLCEGRTMIKVQQEVQIPMPEVYDCWTSQQHTGRQAKESVYIVMQYIPGKILAQTIENLDEEQTRDLTSQLTRILNTLHTVRHTVPGPVDGGRAMAPRLFTTSGAGPFNSLQDLIDWFNECLKLCHFFGRASKQQGFDEDIKDLVMCHMDVHLDNLLLDDSGNLWLIDWDCAGFYPDVFEYVCLKGYAEFMPLGTRSAAGVKFLKAVIDSMETLEAQRMNAKFNAIGYALR
ncbi:putative phosphotransferase enzyme family protein [Phaeomoniella chlamydospora]|uniref:Putative phosphotransferase enzyme family protein n=1 Tax=Phaeomoniella chlamydospora TaxID=158046 RepID=A0A0G2GU47_PHACM|nr:putative phosphotransferase enzyme family protein [Phaeomoniella chlamydospora]